MPATLRFTTGTWSGKDIPLPEPRAQIGRDPTLEVVIPQPDQRFVSRIHAEIVREGTQYVLRDFNSSNGTLLNGTLTQRAVLASGDEIQFGRQGPMARFVCDAAHPETLPENERGFPSPLRPSPASVAAAPPPKDASSKLIRRIVNEAMVTNVKRSRRRFVQAAVAAAIVGVAAAGAFVWFGIVNGSERTFRRLGDLYQGRVVLVEVGVSRDGRYTALGDGSGFFAGANGLIVTNKHVVYTHLYNRDNACLAESFRRRGLSYEKALVISVWPGGTEFRKTPSSAAADRGLGYSTETNTLSLVGTGPDAFAARVVIQCRDEFGGPAFAFSWQPHALDNNDLALLRASTAIEPLPLADSEPVADEDVMVLGFPTGMLPLETNKAEPMRRVGKVLRTRDTIQTDAVVLTGNSGGPLVDRNGNVVGVTTRGTAESLNMAIKVEHVRRLIGRAHSPS